MRRLRCVQQQERETRTDRKTGGFLGNRCVTLLMTSSTSALRVTMNLMQTKSHGKRGKHEQSMEEKDDPNNVCIV